MYFGKLCEKEAKKRSFFLWFCDLFAQADSSIEFSMICSRAAAPGKGEPMARFKAAPGLSGAKAENWVCQAFLKMSQKIFKIGPDGFGAYLL